MKLQNNTAMAVPLQRLVLALWPYWLGFTLGQLILWPFDMANAGVLIGLYLGAMVPLLRENVDVEARLDIRTPKQFK